MILPHKAFNELYGETVPGILFDCFFNSIVTLVLFSQGIMVTIRYAWRAATDQIPFPLEE
jgi:hypothetical protein